MLFIGKPKGRSMMISNTHASEFYVHVRWKPVGLSDCYCNNNMIEQVKWNWKFNFRDHSYFLEFEKPSSVM